MKYPNKIVRVDPSKSGLLTGQHLRLNHDLASSIGLDQAIIISQISFLKTYPIGTVKSEVSLSVKNLIANHFPFYSHNTLYKYLHILEDNGWIKIKWTPVGNEYELTSTGKLVQETLDKHNFTLVSPTLAKELGLIEAILVHRFHFLSTGKENIAAEGSISYWVEKGFPFIQEKTFKRAIASLKKKNLITVGTSYKGSGLAHNTYTVNYPELEKLFPTVKIISTKISA